MYGTYYDDDEDGGPELRLGYPRAYCLCGHQDIWHDDYKGVCDDQTCMCQSFRSSSATAMKQHYDLTTRRWSYVYSDATHPTTIWAPGRCSRCGKVGGWTTKRGMSELCESCEAGSSSPTIVQASQQQVGWYNNQYSSPAHIRFALAGTEARRDAFHCLMKELDSDYPIDPMRKPGATLPVCSACRGWKWNNPTLNSQDMARLARQCKIGLKIKTWLKSPSCKGSWEEKKVVV